MNRLTKTTFGNVVLGARVFLDGYQGQKVDEPTGANRNKHGQTRNTIWESGSGNNPNMQADDEVQTTYYSLKDKPELRHT